MKQPRIVLALAVLAVLLVAAPFTLPLLASPDYSYHFEPGASYTQSDARAALKVFGFSGPPYPARVDWVAPNGTTVSYCPAGGCGVSYDQELADNGSLVWRTFYFYIAGQQRAAGTYTAIAYWYEGMGLYTEMFRADFTLSGSPGPTASEIVNSPSCRPRTRWSRFLASSMRPRCSSRAFLSKKAMP